MNRPFDDVRSNERSEERRRARRRLLTGRESDREATDRPPADMSGAGSSPVDHAHDRTNAQPQPAER
jgi:hypothetical protein